MRSKISKKLLFAMAIITLLTGIISLKSGFHVDELFTFGLSNGTMVPVINDCDSYTGEKLWDEYAYVSEENRFNYEQVFKNQAQDVHPPLYYILIHTVCSVFPKVFVKWVGVLVNILLSFIAFWQIAYLFQGVCDRRIAYFLTGTFMLTMGYVNNAAFFRMYVLLLVWTNALTILFLREAPEEDKNWKFYLELGGIVLGGLMTQYYFAIFCTFACLIYAFYLIIDKRWRMVIVGVSTVMGSIGVATLIFPAMWDQIFNGSRGKEAFANVKSVDFLSSIKVYLEILDWQVFGKLFLFLAFIIIIFAVLGRRKGNYKVSRENKRFYIQILVPVIMYVCMVAKIAPYQTDRYVMNIMALLYVGIFSILILLAGRISQRWIYLVGSMAFIVLLGSYKQGVPYLYRDKEENISAMEVKEEVPCLYIYDQKWKIVGNYIELFPLQNIQFMDMKNMEKLGEAEYREYDSLILFAPSENAAQVVDVVLEDNSKLESGKELFTSFAASAFYLE